MREDGDFLTKEDYAIAKKNGIHYKAAWDRFYIHEWDKHRAITEELNKPPLWAECKELAESNGVSYQMFRRRIRKGLTADQAVVK